MPNLVNYYEILGVSQNATLEKIKKAYYVLALQYHPDKNLGDKQAKAETKFKECQQAYEILSEPGKRAIYDLELQRSQRKSEQARFNQQATTAQAQRAADEEARRKAARESQPRSHENQQYSSSDQQQFGYKSQSQFSYSKQQDTRNTTEAEKWKNFFSEQARFNQQAAERAWQQQADIRRQAEAAAQRRVAEEQARQQRAAAAEEYRRKQEEAAKRREYRQKVSQVITNIHRYRIEKNSAIIQRKQRIDNLGSNSVHLNIDLGDLEKIYNEEIKAYEILGSYIQTNGFGPKYQELYYKALSASKDRNDEIQKVEQLIDKFESKVIQQQQQGMISLKEINKIQHRINELTAENSQLLYQIEKLLDSSSDRSLLSKMPKYRSLLSKISDEIKQAYQEEIASLQALQQHIKTDGFDNSDQNYRKLISHRQHNTYLRSEKILKLKELISKLPPGSLAYGWGFGQQPINPTSSSSPPGNPPSSSAAAGKPPSSNLPNQQREFEVNNPNLKATPQSDGRMLSTFEKIWRMWNNQQPKKTPGKSRSSTKWADNPQGTIDREHSNHYRKPRN